MIYCFFLPLSCLCPAQEQTAAQLLQNVQPSLVAIRATDSRAFHKDGQTTLATWHAEGSGVILDSYGTIATNTHIVANAQRIFVALSDGRIIEAKLVYSSDADFSFITIDPPYPLRPIIWADSSQAQIGTSVMALSNLDNEHQQIQGGEITDVIKGAASNKVELFELNLNLSHGDSGGPLLDGEGRLLGLIMAKRTDEDNKTYAIAANKIQEEYNQYKEKLPESH